MAKQKRVKVTQESSSGRNERFVDGSGQAMSRAQFVKRIERGECPGYHVRTINGVKTPASNPDGTDRNNLG